MTDRELMQQALEALEEAHPKPYNESVITHVEGIFALRIAIEAAEKQEPVAHTLNCTCGAVWDVSHDGVEEMVHAPNPPQRKPLTDEEIRQTADQRGIVIVGEAMIAFARAIEAAHGIKGEA